MKKLIICGMTISAEGPHLDLVDWRHFDSPWIQLYRLGP